MAVDLTQKGFEKASDTVYPRLIACISGKEKQGKSHWALTAPGDIAIFNADLGLEGVVHKFTKEKNIYVYNYTPGGTDIVEMKAMWVDLKKAWIDAFQNPKIRTVITDTATDLWELIRLARLGALTKVMPYHYGPVNAEFREFLKAAYSATTTNLILLHKQKKKYVDDKWKGEYERAGFSDMGFIVQLNAEVWREDEGGPFHILVNDSRHNPTISGVDYPGVDPDTDVELRQLLSEQQVNFPYIAQQALPDTTLEDWA